MEKTRACDPSLYDYKNAETINEKVEYGLDATIGGISLVNPGGIGIPIGIMWALFGKTFHYECDKYFRMNEATTINAL